MNLSTEFSKIAVKNSKMLAVKYKNNLPELEELKSEIANTVKIYGNKLYNLRADQKYFKSVIALHVKNLSHAKVELLNNCFKNLTNIKKTHQAVRKIHDENVIYLDAIKIAIALIKNSAEDIPAPINANKGYYSKPKKTLTLDRKDAFKMLKKLVDFYKDKDQQTIEFDLE